jgi:hypothetical protein
MANISLQELQGVLEKTGLPMGNSFQMGQSKIGARGAIAQQFPQRSGGVRNKIMAQLDSIAKMDQKLSGVYGDPTSSLYIENPMARDSASNIHRGAMFDDVSRLSDTADELDKQRENDIDEVERTYNELTTAEKALEAEERRVETQTKKNKTEAEKQSRVVKTKDGAAFELTKQEARQARNSKVNLNDAKAVSEWKNKSTPEFRKWLEDEGIDGKIKGNLDAKKIKDLRGKWEKDKTKKEVTKSNEKKQLNKSTSTFRF